MLGVKRERGASCATARSSAARGDVAGTSSFAAAADGRPIGSTRTRWSEAGAAHHATRPRCFRASLPLGCIHGGRAAPRESARRFGHCLAPRIQIVDVLNPSAPSTCLSASPSRARGGTMGISDIRHGKSWPSSTRRVLEPDQALCGDGQEVPFGAANCTPACGIGYVFQFAAMFVTRSRSATRGDGSESSGCGAGIRPGGGRPRRVDLQGVEHSLSCRTLGRHAQARRHRAAIRAGPKYTSTTSPPPGSIPSRARSSTSSCAACATSSA